MANGEIIALSASSVSKLFKSGLKNSRSALSKIKASKDEFTFSKSKSKEKLDAAAVASKDDQFSSGPLSSKSENSVDTTLKTDKDDHYIPGQTSKDADITPISGNEDQVRLSRATTELGKETDTTSLARTDDHFGFSATSTAVESNISRVSTGSTGSENPQRKLMARLRTVFNKKPISEADQKMAIREKREQDTADAKDLIDKRNHERNELTEKGITTWTTDEKFQRDALKLAANERVQPLLLDKAENVMKKELQSITVSRGVLKNALDGAIDSKVANAGEDTREAYFGKSSSSNIWDAVKTARSLTRDQELIPLVQSGLGVKSAQTKLDNKVAKIEAANQKLGDEAQTVLHPADLILDTSKKKGHLLAERRTQDLQILVKVEADDPFLSPKKNAEKLATNKKQRISELRQELQQYDSLAYKATLEKRDALLLQTGMDAYQGAAKDLEAGKNALLGRIKKVDPDDPNLNKFQKAEETVAYNTVRQVFEGGNAEKMLETQLQIEKTQMKAAPIASELKQLQAEQNMAKSRNAHIDDEGDTFYDAYQSEHELSDSLIQHERNSLPRETDHLFLDDSQVSMLSSKPTSKRLLHDRNSSDLHTDTTKAENSFLTPKERTEKQLEINDQKIETLEDRIAEYDAKPFEAALAERDRLQVQMGMDAFTGLTQDRDAIRILLSANKDKLTPKQLKQLAASWESGSNKLGENYEKLTPDILKPYLSSVADRVGKAKNSIWGQSEKTAPIPVTEADISAAKEAIAYNTVKSVVDSRNVQNMVQAQLDAEKLYGEIGPDASKLKSLKAEKNLAKAQEAHIDDEGERFYKPFENSYTMKVGIENSERDLIPGSLEGSRVDLIPNGLGEGFTRAFPNASGYFKKDYSRALNNPTLSDEMSGAIPGQPVIDDAIRNMPASKPKRMATEEELKTISGAFPEDEN